MRLFLKIVNIVFFILALLLIGFMLGRKYDIALDENDRIIGLQYSANEQKIRRLVSLIDSQYMEEVNTDSLMDVAIQQIVNQLDPHSNYLNKTALQRSAREMSGSFKGLGIYLRNISDTLTVTQVLPYSPNYLNLYFDDKLIKVDSVNAIGLSTENFQTILNQKPSDSIHLTVLRKGHFKELMAHKGSVSVPSVVSSFMVNDEIGYIKLIRFAEKSATEFRTALLDLKRRGMKTLIFDLRGNPGGIMRIAEEIADEFLDRNELIVYTEDKDEKRKYIYATSKGNWQDGKVYVLIDENSASSSEIVAGALQEYDRATIIGRRSYGKGLVQREVNLGDGTRVRLTVAHYYTPSGRSIQRPYDEGNKAYADDLYRRFRSGELYSKDSIKVNKDLAYKTPTGKIVYGGGGIIPDEFVPVDTMQLRVWLLQHANSNFSKEFFYKKIVQNQYNPAWMSENWFLNHYDITPEFNDYLGVLGIRESILNESEKKLIKNFIKASIAEELFGLPSLYKAWLPEDGMVNRVLELENLL